MREAVACDNTPPSVGWLFLDGVLGGYLSVSCMWALCDRSTCDRPPPASRHWVLGCVVICARIDSRPIESDVAALGDFFARVLAGGVAPDVSGGRYATAALAIDLSRRLGSGCWDAQLARRTLLQDRSHLTLRRRALSSAGVLSGFPPQTFQEAD